MEIVYRSVPRKPDVSIVLLDWSVRESFHSIDYLNQQTVARERYELIWVEYGSRRAEGIEQRLRDSLSRGRPPAVDCWITLGMPTSIYYHKHLAYNVGILAAAGRIVVFCDSDAMFRESFVESTIRSFDENPEVVLHMDEIRNNRREFYPFNYPSFEEVEREGCINFVDGRPAGIPVPGGVVDDPLHTPNYGACMAALRDDLIAIGGADEHVDYLGHICGPYEMTFRLRNLGRREIWHGSEWLYHTWHPGQAGDGNYLGPHDGRHMSTTALDVLLTGRVQPLVENPGIRALREAREGGLSWEPPLCQAIAGGELEGWKLSRIDALYAGSVADASVEEAAPLTPERPRLELTGRALVEAARLRLTKRGPRVLARLERKDLTLERVARLGYKAARFVVRLARRLPDVVRRVHREVNGRITLWDRRIRALAEEGVREVAIVGSPEMTRILAAACARAGITAHVISPGSSFVPPAATRVPIDVLVASLYGGTHWARAVARAGLRPKRLLTIQGPVSTASSVVLGAPPDSQVRLTLVLGPLVSAPDARGWLERLGESAQDPGSIEVILPCEIAAESLSGPAKQFRLRALSRLSGATLGARVTEAITLATGRCVAVLFETVRFPTRGWDASIYWTLASRNDHPTLLRMGVLQDDPVLARVIAASRQVLRDVPGLVPDAYQTSQLGRHVLEAFQRAARHRPIRIVDHPERLESIRCETVIEPVIDRTAWLLLGDDRALAAEALGRIRLDEPRGEPAAEASSHAKPIVLREARGGTARLTVVMLTSSPEVDTGWLESVARRHEDLDADWRVQPVAPGRPLAESCADALDESTTRWVVLLEPGMEPADGTLSALARLLEREPDLAAVSGPMLERRSGRVVAAGLAIDEKEGMRRVIPLYRGVASDDPRAREPRDGTALPIFGICLDRQKVIDALGPAGASGRDAIAVGARVCMQLLARKERVAIRPELSWWIDDPRRMGDAVGNDLAGTFAPRDGAPRGLAVASCIAEDHARRALLAGIDTVLCAPRARSESEASLAVREAMLLTWLSACDREAGVQLAPKLAPTGQLEGVDVPISAWALPEPSL